MPNRLTHYLLPRESNNYRARILHSRSFSQISLFLLFFQIVLSGIMFLQPQVLGYASQISPEKVIELTNQERIKSGAGVLQINPQLSEAARRKAGDMFAFNYWAHVSPSGREPWAFFKEVGYQYTYAGENLARDFSNPQDAVAAWMASPSHKENLLNPRFSEIGIAVVDGTLNGVETTLIVQLFGAQNSSIAKESRSSVASSVATPKTTPTPVLVSAVTSPVPTIITLAETNNQNLILSESKGKFLPTISPFSLTQVLNIVIILFLAGLFITDGVYVYRHGIYRLTGRSLAHALFLLAVGFLLFISNRGVII